MCSLYGGSFKLHVQFLYSLVHMFENKHNTLIILQLSIFHRSYILNIQNVPKTNRHNAVHKLIIDMRCKELIYDLGYKILEDRIGYQK